jgi:hypothetical protein
MKQSTFTLKSLCLLVLSLIFSCQKTDPDPDPFNYVQPTDPYHTLPEITQEGKNTFGCLVNGVVWVPRVEIVVPWYTLDFQFSEKNPKAIGNISCRILSTTQDDFMTVVFGPTFFKPGIYDMTFKNYSDMYFLSKHKDYDAMKSDSLFNYVKVNYIDTSKNIVSGQFQFKLFNNANPKDSIKVTDGRFDLRY